MIMRSTPATLAGITFIRTLEGYAAFPPGTYTPAVAMKVLHAQNGAVRPGIKPAGTQLLFVEPADIFRGTFHHLQEFASYRFKGLFDFLSGDKKIFSEISQWSNWRV